jgi:predicted enzyme related to lactoylglutathione lyase
MKIVALDSMCVWSQNPDKLASFYEKVIGLPVGSRLNLPKDRGVEFKIGNFYFFIGYHDKIKGKAKDPFRVMIGFSVDSVKSVYDNLSKKKVKFLAKPFLSPDKTFYVATAYDPEGNIIQFFSDNP